MNLRCFLLKPTRIMKYLIFLCLSCIMEKVSCCSNSYFIRLNELTNSKFGLFSEVKHFSEMTGCIRHCHLDPACLAFTYSALDGTCYIYQNIPVEPEGTIPETGAHTYWKRSDAPVCDMPPSIPGGQVLSVEGQDVGSRAWFVCDDYFLPDVENGVCGGNGEWQDLQAACVQKTTPFELPVGSKIFPGACIQLIGTPTPNTANTFAAVLEHDNGDENIVIDCRFNTPGFVGGTIVRNNKVNGVYGQGHTDTPVWPFTDNTEFNMTICTDLDKYRVYVDDQEMFTFVYRSPLGGVTTLAIHQGVTIRRIRFTD